MQCMGTPLTLGQVIGFSGSAACSERVNLSRLLPLILASAPAFTPGVKAISK